MEGVPVVNPALGMRPTEGKELLRHKPIEIAILKKNKTFCH
jgi:hypothetical protein